MGFKLININICFMELEHRKYEMRWDLENENMRWDVEMRRWDEM